MEGAPRTQAVSSPVHLSRPIAHFDERSGREQSVPLGR